MSICKRAYIQKLTAYFSKNEKSHLISNGGNSDGKKKPKTMLNVSPFKDNEFNGTWTFDI